ncbi:hypothetical protein [Labrys wisconsinensis]|uniref:Uncharacterized protein n=1 Tax=Labrys wisconsinensis TaxID=425677 RepID=A0ABU0J1J1_9HYPH|nr:hypothetical protein [Labrys wisconsinensis]MDQ0467189.1 hypothetical protein [Labrys wisconsinensis]
MMTLSMLRRFAICGAAAGLVSAAAALSRSDAPADTSRQAARDSAAAMGVILREARAGNLVISREVDGRVVIDAVVPAQDQRGGVRVASLP